ncbi:hypothetical protein GTR02_02200 [Kineococcus sp. R8]|uniref:hypothetical protein n=1 Tax=Kineococcus siccus TaxID=2696567 RepID=UPI001412249A|nr:hypothetical protein [Kineococcus siccus]NAZ80629.1 hypothetical protein [Kineococcus siccus]
MLLSAHGMGLDAPPGWEVRISRRTAAGQEGDSRTRPVLHAATVALPVVRGDFGGGVTGLLSATDLFVSLFEQGPDAVGTALFSDRGRPRPVAADFSPNRLQRTIAGQSGGQWFFTEAGRAFSLYVVLGSHARRVELVNRLTGVLSTLDLTPGDAS